MDTSNQCEQPKYYKVNTLKITKETLRRDKMVEINKRLNNRRRLVVYCTDNFSRHSAHGEFFIARKP